MNNLLAMTVAGSVIVILMLLIRPVTAKLFSANWQYRIGKMVIIFFLVPVSLFAEKLASVFPQLVSQNQYSGTSPMLVPIAEQKNGLLNAINAVDTTMEQHLTIEVIQVVSTIWLFGAIGFAVWHLYCYRRFMKSLQANSIAAPEDTAVLLSSCKAALGIRCGVELMQNATIPSPMLVGLLRPMILLPTANMQEINLKLVLTHELMHLKRKDLWVKMLALLAGTVHWFNPLVHVLRKDISTWGELACDEALATKMSLEEKRLYGEAILNTLDNQSGINTAFCSSFCESKKYIKRRLTMILNAKKIKKHIAIFAAVAVLAIAGVGTAVSAFAADSKEIVNDNVTNVTVEKTASQLDINVDRELTESKQVINVDIKSLESGKFVCLGEYTLEEGDLIAYNLTAEGEGNINVGFYKAGDPSNSDGYLGHMMYAGNSIIDKNFNMKVTDKLAGTYYLWVGNFEGATLDNIKGSVEIAVES